MNDTPLDENQVSNRFITFQKFSNKEDALILQESLEKDGVATVLEDTSASVDITFSGSGNENEFLLKVLQNEFEKANTVLEQQAESIIDQYSRDHYLFQFTNEELREVIEKADEWSKEDYLLSIKILKERGETIDEEELKRLRERRVAEIRRPEKAKTVWVVIGYVSAVFGGIFGVFIGYAFWKSTKTDPTGKKVYVYEEKSRVAGKNMFWIGIICFVFFLGRQLI
jgi:hypothetical protein